MESANESERRAREIEAQSAKALGTEGAITAEMLARLREADLEVASIESELERLREEMNVVERRKAELMRKGFLYAEVVHAESVDQSLEIPERFLVGLRLSAAAIERDTLALIGAPSEAPAAEADFVRVSDDGTVWAAEVKESRAPRGFEDYFASRRISHEDVVSWCSEILKDGEPKRLKDIMAELSADELGKGWRVPGKQAPSNVSWHLGQAAETFESPARGYWQLRSTKELREN